MEQQNNIIDLRRFWRAVRSLKWLYLIGVALSIVVINVFLYRSLPQKSVTGQLLIGDTGMDDYSGMGALAAKASSEYGSLMRTFSVGGFGSSAVDNEIFILSSHEVMLQTVKYLNLNRTYIGRYDDGRKEMLYGNIPVLVEAPAEYFDTLKTNLRVDIKMKENNRVDVKLKKGFFAITVCEQKDVELPYLFSTPYGNLQLIATQWFGDSDFKEERVNLTNNDKAAIKLNEKVSVAQASKLSDIIDVSLEYANVELGKAIVNGIMAEYNATRLDRVRHSAKTAIDFYDGRIAEALASLEAAEEKSADYQRQNTIVSAGSELPLLARQGFEDRTVANRVQNEINYYSQVLSKLQNGMNDYELLPVIDEANATMMNSYNGLITRRRNLEKSAKPGNPTLMKLDEEIQNLRDVITKTSEEQMKKLSDMVSFQNREASASKNRISGFSEQAKVFTGLERDKQYQNSLYLFLIQARENAVLKYYTDADLNFIFQPAYEEKSGLPIKNIIISIVLIALALIGCTCIALIKLWFSKKVEQPMDLAFIGLDKSAVKLDSGVKSMLEMRTMILARPEIRRLYVANTAGDEDVEKKFEMAFSNAGFMVKTIEPADNNMIVSPEFNAQLEQNQSTDGYIIVDVPDSDELFILETELANEKSALVVIVSSSMKRADVKKMLTGLPAAKIFVIITD